VDVFADNDIITGPFPVPDFGDTVNHDESDDTVHAVFDVTTTVPLVAGATKLITAVDNDNCGAGAAPSWVTCTALLTTPGHTPE